jgi:hypothetical protein
MGLFIRSRSSWNGTGAFLLCFYEANAKTLFRYPDPSDRKIQYAKTNLFNHPDEYYLFASRAWITIGVLTEWLQKGCDIPAEKIASLLQSWAA